MLAAFYRSNRTFMELKSCSDRSTVELPEGSNRTFMELKFLLCVLHLFRLYVLIVPLWN